MYKHLFTAALALALAAPVHAATYELDPAHSSVGFKVRHLVSKTAGTFDKVTAKVDYEKGKPGSWKVEAEIDTASINTANKKRDDHLKSPDFFDVGKFPKITFKSTKVEEASAESAKLQGELTMHGVTKPVTLDLEIGGETVDPMGTKKIGFTAKTKVNRKDFGIVYNKVLDAGGMMLGDDVEIVLEIEANGAKVAAQTETKKGKK